MENITLKEMATRINYPTEQALKDRLIADGLMSGNTMSKKGRQMKIFVAVQGCYRPRNLYHRTTVKLLVNPLGQKYLMKQYGTTT